MDAKEGKEPVVLELPELPPEVTLRALSERVTDGITIQDATGRVVYANEAAAHDAGYESAADLVRDPSAWFERFDLVDRSETPISLEDLPGRRVLRGERPGSLLAKAVHRATGAARWTNIRAEPLFGPDGSVQYVVNTMQDVTDRILAEEELHHLAERQAFLVDAAKELAGSLDYRATLSRVAELAVPRLADWCVIDLVESRNTLRPVVIAHADPGHVRSAEELRRRFPLDPDGLGGVWEVIRSGKTATYEVTDELLERSVPDPEYRATLQELGIRSVVIVPLRGRDAILGALTLVWSKLGRTHVREDVGLAEQLASHAALAIESARIHAARDRVSRTLQTALLPSSLPEIAGFDLAAKYWPPGPDIDVGGDFYDAFDRPGGSLGLVVGDVCGKGVEAAAIMGIARQTVRAAGVREDRPSAILRVLNEALLRDRTDLFCTACDVRVRRQGDVARLTVCLGGHPQPFLVRASGTVQPIGTPGMLLGVIPDVRLTDTPGELHPGDGLVLFTDGLVERRGESRESGLRELLADHSRSPAPAVVSAIEAWRGGGSSNPEPDDAVVLVAKMI